MDDTRTSKPKKQGAGYDIVDALFSNRSVEIRNVDMMIDDTQKRVWAALKKGYEYTPIVHESDRYLRSRVLSRIDMLVMYVDLVGSTTMTLEMPEDKLAIIISSFAQEMAYVAKQYSGYVLKFVGDAVIVYFIAEMMPLHASDNAVRCASSMIAVIRDGINPILNQYDYPDLQVKVGLDFGKNIVVRYGADPKKSHVDLLGPPMNIAAKIQARAKPNQILVGDDVYTRLHPTLQQNFRKVAWQGGTWKYRSRFTGKIYDVYEYIDRHQTGPQDN